jgi:hypothetical protein
VASVRLTKMMRVLVAYPGATFNPTLSCNRLRNVKITLSTNRLKTTIDKDTAGVGDAAEIGPGPLNRRVPEASAG